MVILEKLGNLPDYLVNYFNNHANSSAKRALMKKYPELNLETMEYYEEEIPTSNRDPRLKDPNYIPIFTLAGKDNVYIPDVSNPLILTDSGYKYVSEISWKELLSYVVKFGRIKLSGDYMNRKEIRKDRTGGLPDRKKTAQYKNYSYDAKTYNPRTKSYDIIPGHEDDYEWKTVSSYDKSGYLINPTKYIDMLRKIDYDNLADSIKKLYDKILALKKDLRDFEDSIDLNKDYENEDGYDILSNVLDKYSSASSSFYRALNHYRGTIENANRFGSNPSSERYKFYIQDNVTNSYNYLDYSRNYLKQAQDLLRRFSK